MASRIDRRLQSVSRADGRGRRIPRGFTERERQVLRGVFDGLTNKQIAANLRVSEGAIKATLQHLFRKSLVRSRAQLVRVALEDALDGSSRRR
jgi:DNA-binding NarL/FixJ family response regulator